MNGAYTWWQKLIKPRTLFTFMFFGTFCWLILNGKDIPSSLNSIISTLLGFYFGSKIVGSKTEVIDVGKN